jgi:hypothetical protein
MHYPFVRSAWSILIAFAVFGSLPRYWGEDSDVDIVFTYLQLLLTAPASLSVLYPLTRLSEVLHASGVDYPIVEHLVYSAACACAGYVQWFVLLPRLIRSRM